jgi:hypothetical protein
MSRNAVCRCYYPDLCKKCGVTDAVCDIMSSFASSLIFELFFFFFKKKKGRLVLRERFLGRLLITTGGPLLVYFLT